MSENKDSDLIRYWALMIIATMFACWELYIAKLTNDYIGIVVFTVMAIACPSIAYLLLKEGMDRGVWSRLGVDYND